MVRWVALALLLAACASPPASAPPPSPTAAAVPALKGIAAQPSDLPGGLVTCSWSGDLEAWANKVKPSASGYAQQMLDFGQRLRSAGATAAWVQDLSVSEEACQGFYSGSAGLVRHVTGIVIRCRDQAGAASAYRAETPGLLGRMVSSGDPTEAGIATGLGPNSYVATPNNGPGATVLAAWQKNAYYLVFIGYGIAAGDDRLALTKIDARVP